MIWEELCSKGVCRSWEEGRDQEKSQVLLHPLKKKGDWFANRKHFYASISGELKEEVSEDRELNFQGSYKWF